MDALLSGLAGQVQELTVAELIAVVTALGYLILAIRQSIWCWFFAAVSTAIYIVLCARADLYMESVLNVFYFVMALYGWYVWYFRGAPDSGLPVTRWDLRVHAIAIGGICALAGVSGWLLQRYTQAAFPFLDSMTAFSAIWATFLVARKVLENWWYWLAIDAVSAALFWAKDLQLTALLFVFYVGLIPIGLIAWKQSYAGQHSTAMP